MLKIKDNVDLKELEKFGFYHNKEHGFYGWSKQDKKNSLVKSGFTNLETETLILIPEEHRDIICCLGIKTNDGLTDTTRDVLGLDILYDLIKSDMAEKYKE